MKTEVHKNVRTMLCLISSNQTILFQVFNRIKNLLLKIELESSGEKGMPEVNK